MGLNVRACFSSHWTINGNGFATTTFSRSCWLASLTRRARRNSSIAPAGQRLVFGAGSADEAIGHALAAGDFTRSAALIAQHWYRYMDASRVATVRSWHRSLGDDNISTNPLAAHSAAWVAALTGDREAVSR